MLNKYSVPGRHMLQDVAHMSRFVCFSIFLMLLAGCNDSNDTAALSKSPTTQAADDGGFLSTITAALSEGQFTVNNPWTQADLDDQEIGSLGYQHTVDLQPLGRVGPYTTLIQQYRAKRAQCQKDAQVLNANDEPSCYPTNQGAVIAFNGRYGYYCGKEFPAGLGAFWNQMPEPLDGVDYCCRLHDEEVWGKAGYSDECGIVMCLSKASGLPANVMQLLPDVEEARQYWYDGARTICGGNQYNDAPQPSVGP